jgi:1,2-dihydroxy-3-keto-5-methylthiopentene dioxygenase
MTTIADARPLSARLLVARAKPQTFTLTFLETDGTAIDITADVVDVTPDIPNLQAMLDKFNKEHRHAEDEVRFIVKVRGIFYIHPEGDAPLFSIEVEEGDLINVPAGTKHWFDLCADRTIRAIRLFREKAGWTPLYTGDEIASGYQPLCFGPSYLGAKGLNIKPAISLE